ncbi:MAG: hypothetical protein QNJ53_21110 [Pleurocapsa sp. MO_192.B19]|nr:hypothetical protein [Pleurocapsa sp. MO_192.B19]
MKSFDNRSSLHDPENEANKLQKSDKKKTKCLDTWTCSAELEASAWLHCNWGEYRQLSLWKSIPTHNSSSDTTSQECQFTQISETTDPTQENLTSLQWDSPVQALRTQEAERDYNTQLHLFGEKDLDALSKLNPSSVLWNNLKELSDEDFELFLGDLVWQDILLKLKQSRRESLERHTKDSDCLSFPTLTSGQTSTTMRPAGQTKCDCAPRTAEGNRWFKDNGLIAPGYQLGTKAIALMMGFPSNWFEGLTEQYLKNQTTPSQVKPQAESEQDISQDEQLHHHKQPSPFAESSTSTQLLRGDEKLLEHKRERSSPSKEISIPCLVKQPKQPEVKGVIKQDKGDCPKGSGRANRFLVEVGLNRRFVRYGAAYL